MTAATSIRKSPASRLKKPPVVPTKATPGPLRRRSKAPGIQAPLDVALETGALLDNLAKTRELLARSGSGVEVLHPIHTATLERLAFLHGVPATWAMNALGSDTAALLAASSIAERIKQSCNTLLQVPAYAADCSGFAKAVAKEFSITLTGQANDIVGQLISANGWTELGSDDQAGQRAADAAANGYLVIGARKEADHGHVVIVVEGVPLAHGEYPFAYWGKLHDPANAGFGKTVNWAWNRASRDSVTYASQAVA